MVTNSKLKGVGMIKKFYIFAWFLLIGSALASIFSGAFNAAVIVGVSVGFVGLVYAFALWAVTRDVQASA